MLNKNPYTQSKDYDKLHSLILKSLEIVAFVDYRPAHAPKPLKGNVRDVCTVSKTPGLISFSVRGMSYDMIMDMDCGEKSEKELFIEACERLNLGWLDVDGELC